MLIWMNETLSTISTRESIKWCHRARHIDIEDVPKCHNKWIKIAGSKMISSCCLSTFIKIFASFRCMYSNGIFISSYINWNAVHTPTDNVTIKINHSVSSSKFELEKKIKSDGERGRMKSRVWRRRRTGNRSRIAFQSLSGPICVK